MKIAVIGSGGWGTALAIVLHNNGHQVTLWSHTPAGERTAGPRPGEPVSQGGRAAGCHRLHQ